MICCIFTKEDKELIEWRHLHFIILFCLLLKRPNYNSRGVDTHQRRGKREEGKTSEKSEEKERDRGTEGEIPKPIRATDALIREEEQNGKQKRTKRKKQGPGLQPSYSGQFSRLLRRAGVIRRANSF